MQTPTEQGFVVWILAVVAVVVIAWAVAAARAASMNKDPLQQELGALILEMVGNGAGDGAEALFRASAFRALAMQMIVDHGAQQTRLAHALSMVRPRLTPMDYVRAKSILRNW